MLFSYLLFSFYKLEKPTLLLTSHCSVTSVFKRAIFTYNFSYFQDLNIPVPPPSVNRDEPNAKRSRLETDSSNTTIDGTKVYALPNGTVPCNQPLTDLIHLVKPHIRELVEDSNLVCDYFLIGIMFSNSTEQE